MAETFHKPRLYPLVWLLIALLAMFLLDHWLPITGLLPAPFHWLGLIILLPGIIILLQSGASFLKAKTGLLPFSEATKLVTGGLYRFSRNPMYLGMVLFLLGLALFLGSLSALIPVAVFAWIIDRQFIRNEERFLQDIFGEEYLAYRKRVRRWI
jgi:protein-S-isoprenylcysteine O-methyltransferase Ste14